VTVCDAAAGPEPAGGASTSGSGRPWGNPNLAREQAPHGGTSTGPRTAKGLVRLATAHTTGGTYSAANWVRHRYFRVLACRMRLFSAAKLVRAYLPPALAARLATTPPESMPPVHHSNTLKSEITTKTLWSGGRGLWGSSMARSRLGLRRRAEELEAARAERAVLAPWRAAIAGARLAKREALAQRRAARIAKSRQRPYGPSAAGRTCSVDRSEEAAAVDAGLGAARLGAMAGGEAGIDAAVEKPCGASSGAGMGAAVTAPQAAGGPMGVREGIRRAGGFGATLAPTPPPNPSPQPPPSRGGGESFPPCRYPDAYGVDHGHDAVRAGGGQKHKSRQRPYGPSNGAVALGWAKGAAVPRHAPRRSVAGRHPARHLAGRSRGVRCRGGIAYLRVRRTLRGGSSTGEPSSRLPICPADISTPRGGSSGTDVGPTPPPDENAARHASLLACCGAQRRQ
jgi:hypothetical protein